jgi:phosphatidylserine/phosphatidylglycerophosphate/cardiolipin synthase-like enzyme
MKKIILGLIIGLSLGIGVFSYASSNVSQLVGKNDEQIKYYFSQENQEPDKQLIKLIDSTKTNLDIAIYSVTLDSIIDSIIKAKTRNVNVRLIVDAVQSKGKDESLDIIKLQQANIPIKVESHSGLMHLKVTISDNKIVTTGSYNYTQNATDNNDEVLVIINNDKVAQDFKTEFNNMWNDNKRFKNLK